MKKNIITLSFCLLSYYCFGQIDSISFEFDEVVELTELNDVGNGEAYPWISNDGLRIYFTKFRGLHLVTLFSEREHIDGLFSEPVELTINSDTTNNLSPWLTKNELDIYFVSRVADTEHDTKLYHSSREDINTNFDAPVEVILENAKHGFHSSPSFTKDLGQLFLYHITESDEKSIYQYEKTDIDQYILVDSIPVPEGYFPNPGKLSKNGLRYYLSLNTILDNDPKLFVAERKNLESNFDSMFFIDNDSINGAETRNTQPSISSNGRFFVFTRGNGQSWGANDLFLAYNYDPVSVEEYEYNEGYDIKVSPNPASDFVKFEIVNDDQVNTILDLAIYAADGRIIKNLNFENQRSNLYLSTIEYDSGIYFYKVKSDNGDFTSGRFIISR